MREVVDGAVSEDVGAVVDAVALCVEEQYVDPEAGRAAAEQLLAAYAREGRTWPSSGTGLTDAVTAALRSALPDRHLSVRWSDDVLDPSGTSQWDDPDFMAAYWETEALGNFGFERVERLAGNVGLLVVHSVDEPEGTGPTVDAAFGFLAHCSAIIVDLRDTNGGAPSGVAHFLGHLLPPGTPLVELVDRSGAVTEATRVLPVASTVRPDVPVLCLVGPRTVSGCEELVYDLRAYDRATLVGETTVGAANPVDSVVVHPHVVVRVPTARVVHAVTGGSWEGTGIEPDHPCAAAEALDEAHRLALLAVRDRLPDSPVTRALRDEVAAALGR